jgi:prefoldin subunit 5
MVIKELDMNKINNVFLKLTKEIEELRKKIAALENTVAKIERTR